MTLEWPADMVIYRSRLNAKINRNFEVFTATDFLAAITQHIPDKGAQMVRYYGWYSNKMRGQRDKQAVEEAKATGNAVEVIDVSEHKPRRIPSAKWRELINPPSRKATADLWEGVGSRPAMVPEVFKGNADRGAH